MSLNGPGKYDPEAMAALEATEARAVILCVISGRLGHGFEVATSDPAVLAALPQLLRQMADQIEAGGGA